MFQSTLPVRGATRQMQHSLDRLEVSIHAPGEGSDLFLAAALSSPAMFQSTLPVRGATRADRTPPLQSAVSIHAPGEGSDHRRRRWRCRRRCFNPRSR